MSETPDNYVTVRIPIDLAKEVDALIGRKGYKTRAEIVKDALRNFLEKNPQLEHYNLDENGVRIRDPTLLTRTSPNGRIIDVFFKDKRAFCDYDQTEECKHVEFALSLQVVQEIFKRKGWKLPNV